MNEFLEVCKEILPRRWWIVLALLYSLMLSWGLYQGFAWGRWHVIAMFTIPPFISGVVCFSLSFVLTRIFMR